MIANPLPRMRNLLTGRNLVIGVPMIWLFLLAAAPLLIALDFSFSEMGIVYVNNLTSWADNTLTIRLNLGNYMFLGDDPLYFETFLSSVKFAGVTTL